MAVKLECDSIIVTHLIFCPKSSRLLNTCVKSGVFSCAQPLTLHRIQINQKFVIFWQPLYDLNRLDMYLHYL